jgi:hypothetical protein
MVNHIEEGRKEGKVVGWGKKKINKVLHVN